MSVEDERRFDIEKDTEITARIRTALGGYAYVDALETVEPDMVNPPPARMRWLDAPERSDG